MKKNTLTKALAAVAVSAISVSSMAMAVSAADYSGAGDAANAVKKNTITIDTVELTESQAKDIVANGGAVTIAVHLGSAGDGAEVNATGLTFEYDSNITPVKTKGKSVAIDLSSQPVESEPAAELEGRTALFLTTAETDPITSAMMADYKTDVLYSFDFTLPESVAAGDFYPVAISYNDGDRFTYGQGTSDAELGDQAYTFTQGITNGGINIVADPIVTTTTAAPTPTVTTTTKAASNNTPAATTTGAATAKTTTTKAADTKKTDSPKTGVAGAGVAVAGLAIAAGTAFVLRKKED